MKVDTRPTIEPLTMQRLRETIAEWRAIGQSSPTLEPAFEKCARDVEQLLAHFRVSA